MPKDHLARIIRIHHECSTMAELHEETRVLFESITAEARRSRAAALALKKFTKKAHPRR
jgi:hypothetical protein